MNTPASPAIGARKIHPADTAFRLSLHAAGAIVVIVLLSILAIMFIGGKLAFDTFGLGFIWGTEWNPVTQIYGALPAITGTLVTAILALCIAWPVGFGRNGQTWCRPTA